MGRKGAGKKGMRALEAAHHSEAYPASRGSLLGGWGQEGCLRRLETRAYKRGRQIIQP